METAMAISVTTSHRNRRLMKFTLFLTIVSVRLGGKIYPVDLNVLR